MENTSRDSVTDAIVGLMLNYLASIEMLVRQVERQSPTEREELRLELEKEEYGLVTLMKLANKLGLYEKVASRVVIPRHLQELFRAADGRC